MTPESLDRFRKRFHQLYLDNPDAEALAQAGCALIGEIERLARDLGEALHVIGTVRRVRAEALSALADAREQRDEAREVAGHLHRYENDSQDVKDDGFRAATEAIARWDAEKKEGAP